MVGSKSSQHSHTRTQFYTHVLYNHHSHTNIRRQLTHTNPRKQFNHHKCNTHAQFAQTALLLSWTCQDIFKCYILRNSPNQSLAHRPDVRWCFNAMFSWHRHTGAQYTTGWHLCRLSPFTHMSFWYDTEMPRLHFFITQKGRKVGLDRERER